MERWREVVLCALFRQSQEIGYSQICQQQIIQDAPETIEFIKGSAYCDDLKTLMKFKEPEIQRLNPEEKVPTDAVIDANIQAVKNIYTQYTSGKILECSGFSWVKDTDRIIRFIDTNPRWKTEKTRNRQRTVLSKHQREYKIFSETSSDIQNNKVAKECGKNMLSEDQAKNHMKWPGLIKKL